MFKVFLYGSKIIHAENDPRFKRIGDRSALRGYRLIFRKYADITKHDGYLVCGAIYEIDQETLKWLDTQEGYPVAYRRIKRIVHQSWLTSSDQTRTHECFVYKMNSVGARMPDREYISLLIPGLREIGHNDPFAYINAAYALTRETRGKNDEHPRTRLVRRNTEYSRSIAITRVAHGLRPICLIDDKVSEAARGNPDLFRYNIPPY